MAVLLANTSLAQTAFTWQQIKEKFALANPTLKAARLNIDESRTAEITAYLRPNPDFSLTADGFQVSRNQGIWRPLSGVVETPGISYLHERQHKRELRRDTAKEVDGRRGIHAISIRSAACCSTLRNAFVADSASQSGAPERAREPGLLGPRARREPHALTTPAISRRWI